MRIAVDARELAGRPTGVGRYLAELLASWSRDEQARATTVTLMTPHAFDLPDGLVGRGGAHVDVVVLPGRAGTLWEQTTLPRAVGRRADVLFCPGYSAPLLSPIPFVVAVHDVSFCAHPEWFGWREGVRRRWTVKLAARRAARLITISAFSRDEIVRWLKVPASRILVTPLAPARALAHPAVDEAASPEPATQGDPIVLYVGSLLDRRDVPLLVRAFAPIARRLPRVRLVLVGENRTFPLIDPMDVARELGVADRVDVRSYVADDELARLYARASAFAFLSKYEGFGLTPVEAMAAGVPVVAYDTPVAREVYGDAALLVQPGDVRGVTEALGALLDDQSVRNRLRLAARTVLGRLSWDATARATLDALEGARRS